MFQLIARRYERLATIVTTNKSFAQWGEVFGDDQAIASAKNSFGEGGVRANVGWSDVAWAAVLAVRRMKAGFRAKAIAPRPSQHL